MRILDDRFLLQILRAPRNRNALWDACGVPSSALLSSVDQYDCLSTLAQLLTDAGFACVLKLGQLRFESTTLHTQAEAWLRGQLCLRHPLSEEVLTCWTRHVSGVQLISRAECVESSFAAAWLAERRDATPAAGEAFRAWILPVNRDGQLSGTRRCAALVADGRKGKAFLIHVSDLPHAAALGAALQLLGVTAVNVVNNPASSALSHEAALLAAIGRCRSGRRPAPKRTGLRVFASEMARARAHKTRNADVAARCVVASSDCPRVRMRVLRHVRALATRAGYARWKKRCLPRCLRVFRRESKESTCRRGSAWRGRHTRRWLHTSSLLLRATP
jgi:hypothetical protein